MPSKKRSLCSLLALLSSTCTQAGVAAEAQPAGQTLYPAGSQQSFKGPEAYFTGEVQVDLLFPGNETAHYSGAYVIPFAIIFYYNDRLANMMRYLYHEPNTSS